MFLGFRNSMYFNVIYYCAIHRIDYGYGYGIYIVLQ